MRDSATVIFLFTDIAGSTARWERNGKAMGEAVRRHDALMNAAISAHRGRVFKTAGDSFCAAFATVTDAIAAAHAAQRELANEDWSDVNGLDVRMAIHGGSVEERDGDYFGAPLNRVARMLVIGHGGQVLLSSAAADLAQGALPDDVRLSYIGRHRLRDFEAPEHIYQLDGPGLRSEFPALRSLEGTPHNLPIQLTSFVGRDADLERLRESIETTRLLSLAGTGGVGKSRLAQRLAETLLDRFIDGVWLVDLSLAHDRDAVAAETASTLKVRAAKNSVTDAITGAISDQHVLLVLDGCEHVLAASALMADAILRACPNATILATTRQPLDVEGEFVYNVDVLQLDAAVKLFAERARAASSKFSLTADNADAVADICRRLDGIPLALELAAPKAAVLGPKQILARLDERFRLLAHTGGKRLPRQQTLRALIDWSFDLLDEDERTVFRRMSVFAGGCTLEAASAVCGDETLDEWRVFELLSSLVTKSLVVTDAAGDVQRYRMLNSIRDYAREQLDGSGEFEQAASKHARYYAAFANDIYPLVESLEDVRWKDALAPELDNLRAVLQWTLVEGRAPAVALGLLSGLHWPELVTTPQEAIRWFDEAERRANEAPDPATKARVLRHRVRLEWIVGRTNAEAVKNAIATLEAAREAGDPSEIAYGLANLASAIRDSGDLKRADALFAEAFREPGALSTVASSHVLRNWAITNLQADDVEIARQRFTEVARSERPGSEMHASALLNLGELEFAVGNFEAAQAAARRAKEIFEEINAAPLALVFCNLAAYAIALDQLDEARRLLRDAIALLTRSSARWIVDAIEHHALLAALLGDHERAAALMGFSDAQRAAAGSTRQRTERHGYERLQALLATACDERELAANVAAGSRLTVEQAIEHASAITQEVKPAATESGA